MAAAAIRFVQRDGSWLPRGHPLLREDPDFCARAHPRACNFLPGAALRQNWKERVLWQNRPQMKATRSVLVCLCVCACVRVSAKPQTGQPTINKPGVDIPAEEASPGPGLAPPGTSSSLRPPKMARSWCIAATGPWVIGLANIWELGVVTATFFSHNHEGVVASSGPLGLFASQQVSSVSVLAFRNRLQSGFGSAHFDVVCSVCHLGPSHGGLVQIKPCASRGTIPPKCLAGINSHVPANILPVHGPSLNAYTHIHAHTCTCKRAETQAESE